MTAAAAAASRNSLRRVWTLSWPLIVSNLTVPALGIVDTAVMGHLPDPAFLGAVSVGAMIFNFLFWGLGFLRMGAMGFTAQASGSGDAQAIRAILGQAVVMGIALGLAAVALQAPILAVSLWALEADAGVETLTGAYFAVRIWGAPATLVNYAILGWLLDMQRPRTTLALQVAINGVNIALDLLFVFGFGWGIEGVAAATVIAETAGLALGLIFVAQSLRTVGGARSLDAILQPASMVRMLRVNIDIFLRTLGLLVSMGYFIMRGAALGTDVLAANAVLINFVHFAAFGLDGFAHTATVLVGQAQGARNRLAFRRTVIAALILSGAVALMVAAVYAATGPLIAAAMTDIAEIRALAVLFLPWLVLMPIVSVAAFTLDSVFIGATRGPEMRNAMIVSLAVYLPAIWMLSEAWGNHGLWLGLMVFYLARGATLAAYYPRIERAAADG